MPNTFATFPLVDPRDVRRNRARFRRDEIPELAYANSFYCPSGRWPARGWILVRRSSLNLISNYYRTDFTLQFEDFRQSSSPLTFNNLAIVQARCVSRGIVADPAAVYLVEITDMRGVLWNEWVSYPTTSAYNIRAPAYPETFYAPSMNGGSAWTWTTLVQDLWNQMSAFLGAFPGLPAVPSGTPEGWWFPGAPAWVVLNDIMAYLGFVIVADLTKAQQYTIVVKGATDAVFTALTTRLAPIQEDDFEYIDAGSGRLPSQVLVMFHRRNQYYGTEETVRRDSQQWSMTPAYTLLMPSPVQFQAAAGIHYLWSGFTIRFDVDGNPLAADIATAATVATNEVTSYFAQIYDGTAGYMRRVYTGTQPFVTGSLVDGVAWKEDFRDRQGFQTELSRGTVPPWPQVYVKD